jgi:hypothetical protein
MLNQCRSFKKLEATARRAYRTEKGRCFRCLGGVHRRRDCTNKQTCDEYTHQHHAIIHGTAGPRCQSRIYSATTDAWDQCSGIEEDNYTNTFVARSAGRRSFRVVPLQLQNPGDGRRLVVNALLDEGSEETFVSSNTTRGLGIVGQLTIRKIGGIGNPDGKVKVKNDIITSRSQHDGRRDLLNLSWRLREFLTPQVRDEFTLEQRRQVGKFMGRTFHVDLWRWHDRRWPEGRPAHDHPYDCLPVAMVTFFENTTWLAVRGRDYDVGEPGQVHFRMRQSPRNTLGHDGRFDEIHLVRNVARDYSRRNFEDEETDTCTTGVRPAISHGGALSVPRVCHS